MAHFHILPVTFHLVIRYSREVAQARAAKAPIVALESTIIAHGLPKPQNLTTALEVESIVRSRGATPATIAIFDGEIHVGLEEDELERIASEDGFTKASIRDLPILIANTGSAATTVAATSRIAALAEIEVFATGGLGGVHRDASTSWDESADLMAIATTPILVVCAGVKSILDVPATLERLETLSVPVVGFQTNHFPGFYLAESGEQLEHRCDSPAQVAAIWRARAASGSQKSGMILANPASEQMEPKLHERILQGGLAAAKSNGVHGKAVTPFLLEYFHEQSEGESLRVNIEIIRGNAALAADIAVALASRS